MNTKYINLPELKSLRIENYDLYNCPFCITFNNKLNIICGTNGIGKTTLLSIIQYSIIGPYCRAQTLRNYGGEARKTLPMYDELYFRNRMTEINKDASVTAEFTIDNHCFVVKHSLYSHRILSVVIDEKNIKGENSITYRNYEKNKQKDEKIENYLIYKYHQLLLYYSLLPDENSLIMMMNEVMFFTEDRNYTFWNDDITKLCIAKYFMDKDKYFDYEKIKEEVKMLDSKFRLKTYEMSFVKRFINNSSDKESDPNMDINELSKRINEIKESIKEKNELLIFNNNKVSELRIEKEEHLNICNKLEDDWYKHVFPIDYIEKNKKYIDSINNGVCPFCESSYNSTKDTFSECFFCGSKISKTNKKDLIKIENEIDNQKKVIQLLQDEINNQINEIRIIKEEIFDLENKEYITQNRINSILPNGEYESKYQQLEKEKALYYKQLTNKKNEELSIQKELDSQAIKTFKEYSNVFTEYAGLFFGSGYKIQLQLVSDQEDSLFKLYINNRSRNNYYELSESQRIFIDLSFRFSILSFFHNNSYLLCETPYSTLDAAHEESAVDTFSKFIDNGNALFLTANHENNKLIKKLEERYEKFTKINLKRR